MSLLAAAAVAILQVILRSEATTHALMARSAVGDRFRAKAVDLDTLRYRLTFAHDDSLRPVVDVRVQFRGNASGRTVIELPHSWAGHSDLERSVSQLVLVRPATARLIDADSAHHRYVTHA